jgi:hypothetical protein
MTRSRLSFTALSGRPTTVKEGLAVGVDLDVLSEIEPMTPIL